MFNALYGEHGRANFNALDLCGMLTLGRASVISAKMMNSKNMASSLSKCGWQSGAPAR